MTELCLNFLDSKLARHLKKSERRRLGKIDFASNDYLGFAKSPELHALFCQKMGSLTQLGSTGSRLLTGNSPYYEHLEQKIARYHGEEAGLLFTSGYVANLALLSAVLSRDDTVIYDEKVHASIRDGIVLSRARSLSFRHNAVDHLAAQIKRCKKPPFVVVESLYSTDGTRAPLEAIAELCPERLIVDEAHATGVFGPGLVTMPVFARVHTFSKALGVQGAIVLGSQKLRDYLITTARPFIYTTALSMPHLVAIECAYTLLHSQKPFPYPSPILSTPLRAVPNDFDIRPLRYPTVLRGEECLRICLHTFNTPDEIRRLYAWLHCDRD